MKIVTLKLRVVTPWYVRPYVFALGLLLRCRFTSIDATTVRIARQIVQ